jgi:hypothetical protein
VVENPAGMERTYAYLAGVIDMRGFISFGRKGHSYYARIGLSDTTPVVPNLALATLSGRISHIQPRQPSYHTFYMWEATREAAREPLLRLRPYLRLKQRHADIALEMLDLMRNQSRPISAEGLATRVHLFEEMDRLNRDRRRRKHPITG